MLYIVLWYVITLHILFIYSLLSSILFYAYAKEKKIKDYVKGYVEYQWNGKILYYTIRMFYFSLHSLHSGVSFQYSIVIQMRWNMYMILGWSKVSHIREALISNKLLDKEAAIENKWITNIYSTCQQTLLFLDNITSNNRNIQFVFRISANIWKLLLSPKQKEQNKL